MFIPDFSRRGLAVSLGFLLLAAVAIFVCMTVGREHGNMEEGVSERTGDTPVAARDAAMVEEVTHAAAGAALAPAAGEPQEVELPPGHPSDKLLAASVLVREQWSDADAAGNRERSAVYRSGVFKYPLLRVVEQWSGKDGEMTSRLVMVADHLLAAPKDGVSAEDFRQQVEKLGFTIAGAVGRSSLRVAFAGAVEDPSELPRRVGMLAVLDESVDYAEPDYLVWPCLEPNDPAYVANQLWGLNNFGRISGYTTGADIDAQRAWDVRTNASDVVVAVTDTGIRYDHLDLVDNMWSNNAEIAGDGIDNDANGLVDDVHGFDAVDDDGDPMDTQGHGTHCAGTIGATGNNGVGVTGVAWDVQLMAGRFLGEFGGTTSDAIRVIDYARTMGADVINASWGGSGRSTALMDAIAACGVDNILFVAAAGNSGSNNDAWPHYPSGFELPNIVAVAATGATDKLTGFSCYGVNSVDIAAPGWLVRSTFIGGVNDYRYLHGTSMAAPHVTGALALARAQHPDAAVDELTSLLYATCDKLPDLEGKIVSGGRLNLHGLLTGAVPPPRLDDFNTALVLHGGAYATWAGSSSHAGRDPDESSYSPTSESRTLWFAWVAPHDGFTSLRASSLGAGQRLVLFRGDTRATLEVLADTGAVGANQETRLEFVAEAGVEYRITTASDSAEGELFTLNLELVALHDLLSHAVVLDPEGFEVKGTTRGATAQPFEIEAPHAGVGGGHSVWYRWTAPQSGTFTMLTEGSEMDTVLAVYSGDPGNPSAFTAVAANDDIDAAHRWSRVDFSASAGVDYYIAVDSLMGGQPGNFVLRGTMPAAPTIASEPRDAQLPLGSRIVFSVSGEGTPPLRYQWFRNGEPIPGAWESSYFIDPLKPNSFGSYHAVVSNSFGSASSRTAELSELRHGPEVIWSTGDIALPAGMEASIGVRATGSLPLAYVWKKDGMVMPGANSPSISFPSVSDADAAVYSCTVSNDMGTAEEVIVTTVVTSPFESFDMVLDNVPTVRIQNLTVIDGKCYAVAGQEVLVSEDGRAWQRWSLPGGFNGSAIAKHRDGYFYCLGINTNGKYAVSRSVDGVNWINPVELNGMNLPSFIYRRNPVAKLDSQHRWLVAMIEPSSSSGTWGGAPVFFSVNGVDWLPSKRRKIDGATEDLLLKSRFQFWGGRYFAPGYDSSSTYFESADGITWQEIALPVDGSGKSYGSGVGIGTDGERLVLSCAYGAYSTTDGVNWQMDGSRSVGSLYSGREVVSLDGMVMSFPTWGAYSDVIVGSSTSDWASVSIKPATHTFSAVTEFGGALIYGTNTGRLVRYEQYEDLFGATDEAYPLGRVEYLNDEFIAYQQESGSGNPEPILLSGDGRNWRKSRSFSPSTSNQTYVKEARVFLGGRYFSKDQKAGWHPAAMSSEGRPAGVVGGYAAAQHEDGSWLVVGSSSTAYSVSEDQQTWQSLGATGLYAASDCKLVRFNGSWFVSNSSAGTPEVYSSADGITWAKARKSDGSFLQGFGVTVFNDKLYLVHHYGTKLYESGDGVNWVEADTRLQIGTTHQTGSANLSVRRLFAFNGSLIMLIGESSSGRSFVYFTGDARNWYPGNTPVDLADLNVGGGVLVGVTSTGGILTSGSTGAGGAAPIVEITYPPHNSTHVSGNIVEITGTVTDPEGQPVTTECLIDGQSIGTTTDSEFHFQFRPSSTSGHVVSVRSADAGGVVGSHEAKVLVSPPQLRNAIDISGIGTESLPQVAWASFRGRAYVAGEKSLFRTRGDGTWEEVLLPTLPGAIRDMVVVGDSLVLLTSNSALVTRDGVNWTQHGDIASAVPWYSSSADDFYAVTPGGAVLQPVKRSIDGGLNWIDLEFFNGTSASMIRFMTAYGAVFAGTAAGGVYRSDDDGAHWQQVADFTPPATGQVRMGLFSGRLFWGMNGYWRAVSDDGENWHELTGEPLQTSKVVRVAGRFVGLGPAGMVWSANGHLWQSAKTGPKDPAWDMLVEDGGNVLVGDSRLGVWKTTDGKNWDRILSGRPLAPYGYTMNVGLADMRSVVGDVTIQGERFMYGSADGLEWKPCSYHGGVISGVKVSRFWSNGVTGFAATSMTLPDAVTRNGLWRTSDGKDWEQVWEWPDGEVADMVHHDGRWWCLGANGALRSSDDAGLTWSGDQRPPGLLSGQSLIRFDGAWVAIGAKVQNHQGPNAVFVSTDGVNWDEHGAPGAETAWAKVFWAIKDGTLVLTSSTGKIFAATSKALAWTHAATVGANYTYGNPVNLVGSRFVVRGRAFSDDGFAWTTGSRMPDTGFSGVYIQIYGSKPYWSADGLTWSAPTGVDDSMSYPSWVFGNGWMRMRSAKGQIWQTVDGMDWELVHVGASDFSVSSAYGRQLVVFGDTMVVAGTEGLLLHSDDQGRTWIPGTTDGAPLLHSDEQLKISQNELIAIFANPNNYSATQFRHFRSVDGSNWSEIPGMAALGVADVAWSGSEWRAIRENGELMVSTNGGVDWTAAGAVTGAQAGYGLTYFNGMWIATGTVEVPGSGSQMRFYTSTDGLNWTDRGLANFRSWNSTTVKPRFFIYHGWLYYGAKPTVTNSSDLPILRTQDGLTWSQMGTTGTAQDMNGATPKFFVPVTDGYLTVTGSGTRVYFWKAPLNGGSWTQQPLMQQEVMHAASLNDGERLFLFGPGIMKEWTEEDIELGMSNSAPATLGVGDLLEVDVSLENFRSKVLDEGIVVDAWFSSDRFFGDGNDHYIGWTEWNGASPGAGATATQLLSFELPNNVRPGDHYLILKLRLPDSFLELNRANNIAISDGLVVTIPQRRLTLQSLGNGTVNADMNAEYYPQGARVSLVATPGKGARFAGWGGDAFGSLSEAVVIMDTDKTIEADFISTAVLTTFARGGGRVEQAAADGIYEIGSSATLQAIPLPGWTFSGWRGALSGDNPSESILMDGNRVVTARFTMSLDDWRSRKFTHGELADAGVSGAGADADGDGLANWREWLRGTNPKDASEPGRDRLSKEGRWVVLRYTRMEQMPDGHSVRCRFSSNLGQWAGPTNERVVSSSGGVETVEVRMDASLAPQGFLFIEEIQPEP